MGKEILKVHKPYIFGVLETRVSKAKANMICNKLGFDQWLWKLLVFAGEFGSSGETAFRLTF